MGRWIHLKIIRLKQVLLLWVSGSVYDGCKIKNITESTCNNRSNRFRAAAASSATSIAVVAAREDSKPVESRRPEENKQSQDC